MPVNTNQEDAEDRKTRFVQVALYADQDTTHQELVPEGIILFVHDAPQHVRRDNSFLELARNLLMLFAVDVVVAELDSKRLPTRALSTRTRVAPRARYVRGEPRNPRNALV